MSVTKPLCKSALHLDFIVCRENVDNIVENNILGDKFLGTIFLGIILLGTIFLSTIFSETIFEYIKIYIDLLF